MVLSSETLINKELKTNETSINPDLLHNNQNNSNTVINPALINTSTGLENGTKIGGKYKIERKLEVVSGEANLYLCSYRNNEYIAKVYKRQNAIKEEVIERLKKINSKYISKIYDMGYWEGFLYEITPYFKNGSLQGKKISLSDLKQTIIPALNEGLHVLHSKGIIHKDLKPSNIMVSDDKSSVVIIDFGISSALREGNTMLVTETGFTPEYAAPEAFKKLYFDLSDYYSLGITIYELYFGHTPFSGINEEEIERYLESTNIPFPKDTPEELEQLIIALTYDIKNRNDKNNPNRRWGYEEVKNWCAGIKQIIPGSGNDKGVVAGDIKPYNFKGEYYSKRAKLVRALATDWTEGKKQVYRGYLSEHFKGSNPELAGYCKDAEENSSKNNEDIQFMTLLYKLDKDMESFVWKGKIYRNLSELGDKLINALNKGEKATISFVNDALNNKAFTTYAEIMEADNKFYEVLESFEKLHKHKELFSENELYKLGYILSDDKTLTVGDKEFKNIDDLIILIQQLKKNEPKELEKLSKKLIVGDTQLSVQFYSWLAAQGYEKDILKWEASAL